MTISISTCACPAGKPGLITTTFHDNDNFYDIKHNCSQGSEEEGNDTIHYINCQVDLKDKYYCKMRVS